MKQKRTKYLSIWAAVIAVTALAALTVLAGCKNTAAKISGGTEAKPKFTVTVQTGGHGKIKAAPAVKDGKAEKDSIITFTAQPDTGYKVDSWTVNPAKALIEGGKAGDKTAKVKITANTTVKLSFKAEGGSSDSKYKVTYTAGTGGTISADAVPSDGMVEENSIITFTAQPDTGYKVDSWTVTPAAALIEGGKTGDKTAKVKITANTTVKLSFKAVKKKYQVALKYNIGGTVTANPELPPNGMMEENAEITFNAAPITGYTLEKWELNGTQVNGTALTYSLKVTEQAMVKVTFKEESSASLSKYKVTFNAWSNEAFTAVPELPHDGTVAADTEITFTAAPDAFYIIEGWTVSPASALIEGGKAGDKTAKVKITANTTITVNGTSFKMIGIEAVNDGILKDDKPPLWTDREYKVSLSPYSIGETEVTQALWTRVMGKNPSSLDGSAGREPDPGEVQENRPVEYVSWFECAAFCNELTKKIMGEAECVYYSDKELSTVYTKEDAEDQRNENGAITKYPKPVYAKWANKGFRLPTSAEWGWAAKAGSEGKWAGAESEAELADCAWYILNGGSKTHEVKLKKPNNWGLYDMSGNVAEWCWDWYSIAIYDGQDPKGENDDDSGIHRTGRGGTCVNTAEKVKNQYRFFFQDTKRATDIGFRLACGSITDGGGEAIKFPVKAEAGVHGKIRALPAIPASGEVAKDSIIFFQAEPDHDYSVDEWTVTGGTVLSGGKAGDKTARVKITDGTSVKVTFKYDPVPKFNVTIEQTAGGTLTATPVLPQNGIVDENTEITFTAEPQDGHVVHAWTIKGGTILSGGSFSSHSAKVKITSDTSVKVTFAPVTPPAGGIYDIDGVSFKMIDIKAVKDALLGDNFHHNNKEHKVSLSAYSIGETEVTQELWQKVMENNNPSHFDGSQGKEAEAGEVQKKRPAENMDWRTCILFCNELTKKTPGLGESQCIYYSDEECTQVYTQEDIKNKKVYAKWANKGFRLPTEAEWEWAAKGGMNHKFAGTNDWEQLGKYSWYKENSGGKTHEVKKKLPNGYGLYDMSGNVREWCWDIHTYTTPEGGQDPTGAVEYSTGRLSSQRVYRSHCYFDAHVLSLPCAGRDGSTYYYGNLSTGLRLVCRRQ